MTQTRPALFISHSSKDKAWAERLHDALVADGYGAFLDSHPDDGIHPGADWEKLLWLRLRQCGGVVVLCSANWLKSPWCVAEAMIAREHGKTIFLLATEEVIDGCQVKGGEGAEEALRIPDFLKGRQFISIAGLKDEQALELLWTGFEKEKLNEEFAVLGPPYPGLEPFRERDAAVFFGRLDKINEVKNVLNQRRQSNASGFIMVLGASGCGKSSLVRAGVLPRLRRAGEENDGGAEWLIVPPFFGREGLEGLAFNLETAFDEAGEPQAPGLIHDQIDAANEQTGGSERAAVTIRKLGKDLLRAHRLPDAHVLLVLDQLEEVFATSEGSDARAMLRLLLDASAHPASRIVVLATLRSDFLDAFQKFEGAAERYEKITLDPMQKERFVEIIEGPAHRCGLKLGPGLSQRMVEDTKYADALPLLAFTLKELYEKGSADNLLTLEGYEGLFPPVEVRAEDDTRSTEKGVAAAIKHVADTILKNSDFAGLKKEDARLRDLRSAFFRLAEVGPEGQFTRRIARREDVTTSDAVAKVLEKFEKQRLLVPGVDAEGAQILSVAHEALFRVWDTLRDWLLEDRKALALRAQIEEAAATWMAETRPEDPSPAPVAGGPDHRRREGNQQERRLADRRQGSGHGGCLPRPDRSRQDREASRSHRAGGRDEGQRPLWRGVAAAAKPRGAGERRRAARAARRPARGRRPAGRRPARPRLGRHQRRRGDDRNPRRSRRSELAGRQTPHAHRRPVPDGTLSGDDRAVPGFPERVLPRRSLAPAARISVRSWRLGLAAAEAPGAPRQPSGR